MLPSCQVSLGQSGCSQMYTIFSALSAAIVGRILRKHKRKHRKICGEYKVYSPHLRFALTN